MDENVKAALLRFSGRISALEVLVHEIAKTCPGGSQAIQAAATSIAKSADFAEQCGKDDMIFIANGLREGLRALSDAIE